MRPNRDRHRIQPRLEGLESMTLLSGMAAVAPLHVAAATQGTGSTTSTQNVSLSGTARGFYTVESSNPDTGATHTLLARGRVNPLGQVNVTGSYTTPGFILNGTAHGTLTLINARGSLTLKIDQAGPLPGPGSGTSTGTGSSASSLTFQFTIQSGTGKYAGAQGGGTVVITSHPSGSAHVGSNQLGGGRVSLTFKPGASPL